MEYHYPKFTPEMKKTHTILIPNMAVTQFRLMEYALRCEGYKCELLGNCGSAVAQLGLKYVHNDNCYPALMVISPPPPAPPRPLSSNIGIDEEKWI